VFDLLNSTNTSSVGGQKQIKDGEQGLRIRWTKKEQFIVENLFVFECQTPQEVLDLFKFGAKNRILASHNLNQQSSRSHAIFTLTVESQDASLESSLTVSKLQLVDLAGSER
jgi:kinesin family protein 4/21/27